MRRSLPSLREILFDRRFLTVLFLINAGGAASGYLWYARQLAATPWYYWPFVPDSPLSATLFALALFSFLSGRRGAGWQFLALVASAWIIKYGLWAMGIITGYWLAPATPTLIEWALWLSHLGMVAEGCLYLPFLAVSRRQAFGLTLWLVLNDYIDYGLGQHPYLFLPQQETLALALAIALTSGLSLVAWGRAFLTKNHPNWRQENGGPSRI